MKKTLFIFLIFIVTGCTKKADMLCTSQTDLFKTEIGLYFNGNNLVDAYNISTYDDESFALQVCEALGNKVSCYDNKVEITSFYEKYKDLTKYSIVSDLEKQGFTCK